MTANDAVGVDGCRAGWFFVAIDAGGQADFGLASSVARLWQTHYEARAILIDIPIGMIDRFEGQRVCDAAARRILKPLRHSSIFSPPCRQALAAQDYELACRINHRVCGRKLSIQTWGIVPKIREVDEFLQRTPEARGVLRETHPEICFWAMAGRVPMLHGKKRPAGRNERLNALCRVYSHAPDIYKAALDRYPRKQVARDDILDALANALTATRLETAGATLPELPPVDRRGLPMEMVYARFAVRG
ncbi:MAG: DUF429 domain-containing protein [Desulfosarcina sp.]|jgi:predicted RNase H-like nuclease